MQTAIAGTGDELLNNPDVGRFFWRLMINFKYFAKGFISVRGIDSPALALGASLIAIGAIYKNLGFSIQESFLSTLFTYALPGW